MKTTIEYGMKKIKERKDRKMPKIHQFPSSMRNVFLRITKINVLSEDNPKLGLKAGDTIEYTKDDIIAILLKWGKRKKFKFFLIEHNEDPDNIHYHIVLVFDTATPFEQIKSKFPYGHISQCIKVRNCVRYLVHADNPEKAKYVWEDIITNDEKLLDSYKEESTKKLNDYINLILAGEIKEFELNMIDPKVYLKYKRKIKDAFEYRQSLLANNPNRALKVIVLQGPPRVGKSLFTKVYAEKHNKSICFSSSSNDPWQEYRGQDIFVYDDFNYSSCKIEDLLKAFDPHNTTTVSARYKNRLFVGDTIFVCTNTPIIKWYTWASHEHRVALFERISCVLQFSDIDNEGKTFYTVNRVYESGQMTLLYDRWGRYDREVPELRLTNIDDNREHEFDLNKYINVESDSNETKMFLQSIEDM